ncbi:hypothetical protein LZ189_12185, partial [Rhodovulum sulfidophilum]|nr:hypothetical protein [Rhodovulum sulfidophilum]
LDCWCIVGRWTAAKIVSGAGGGCIPAAIATLTGSGGIAPIAGELTAFVAKLGGLSESRNCRGVDRSKECREALTPAVST